jgi:hypothetical protein
MGARLGSATQITKAVAATVSGTSHLSAGIRHGDFAALGGGIVFTIAARSAWHRTQSAA